jgi:3-deoxy-7-phosphoheptulonate synthase
MLVVMHGSSTPAQIDRVLATIRQMGLTPHPMPGPTRTAIGITGNTSAIDARTLEVLPGVLELIRVTKPYKLASREMHEHDTVIRMPQGTFGDHHFTIIAGPCSVENEATILRTADWLMAHGIHFLRAGAFKPRTSPYASQGLGHEGLFPIIAATRSTFRLFRRPKRFAICRSW